MACNSLNAGISRGCRTDFGSIREFYVAVWGNITVTEPATGRTITTMTTATTGFYTFQPNEDTGSWNCKGTVDGSKNLDYYEHWVTAVFGNLDATTITTLQLLGAEKVMVMVKTFAGEYVLLGKNLGLNAVNREFGSGSKINEYGGWNVELRGLDTQMPWLVDSATALNCIMP